MLRALYLSNSFEEIKSANYQLEIYNELCKHFNINLIELNKIPNNEISKTIYNKKKYIDLIIVGHSFLGDTDGKLNKNYKLNLKNYGKPIIFFLNKEYVNLKFKLNWINENKPKIIISHSQKFINEYQGYFSHCKLNFVPFAADHNLFSLNYKFNKDIDFAFSGILKNLNKNSDQSNLRIDIMNEIFYNVTDISFLKKKIFRNYKIFWNSIPRNKYAYLFSRIIGKYQFFNIEKYALLQKRSKSFLNTLSPWGIVSPRYFENFLSKCLIFSEESEYIDNLNIKNLIITFKNKEEFKEKFFYYLNNEKKRNEIIEKSYQEGYKFHTWKYRIDLLSRQIIEKI